MWDNFSANDHPWLHNRHRCLEKSWCRPQVYYANRNCFRRDCCVRRLHLGRRGYGWCRVDLLHGIILLVDSSCSPFRVCAGRLELELPVLGCRPETRWAFSRPHSFHRQRPFRQHWLQFEPVREFHTLGRGVDHGFQDGVRP